MSGNDCVHHWLLGAVVDLDPAVRARYDVPLIGRDSVCKRCGTRTVLPERVAMDVHMKEDTIDEDISVKT